MFFCSFSDCTQSQQPQDLEHQCHSGQVPSITCGVTLGMRKVHFSWPKVQSPVKYFQPQFNSIHSTQFSLIQPQTTPGRCHGGPR